MLKNIFKKIAKKLISIEALTSSAEVQIWTQSIPSGATRPTWSNTESLSGLPCIYREDYQNYPDNVHKIENVFIFASKDLESIDFSKTSNQKFKIKYNEDLFNVTSFKQLGNVNNESALIEFKGEK